MKTILLGVMLFFLGISLTFGQKKQKITIQSLTDVTIDADLSEWGMLQDVAEEGLWFYQLGQDAANLYIAVRIDDPVLQNLVARNGILFSVLTNKKNRDDIQFLYPYPDSEVKRAMLSEDNDPDRDYKTVLIDRSRGYLVNSFPTVPNGLLSLQNGYGLHAEARVAEGLLYYEAVVPKALLDYTTPTATLKLAINDGFTTLISSNKKKSTSSRSMYGPYYRGRPAPRAKNKLTMTVLLQTTIDEHTK